jgi:flagellar biosynthesis GTPase FlhF
MTTRTYRGRSLDELLPRVRAELGPDAVILRQREGLTGGVAGFFQKQLVEIEAAGPEDFEGSLPEPGDEALSEEAPSPEPAARRSTFDLTDDSPALPSDEEPYTAPGGFLEQLSAAQEAARAFLPPAHPANTGDDFFAPPPVVDAWAGWGADPQARDEPEVRPAPTYLPPPAAPRAHQPQITPQVPAIPMPEARPTAPEVLDRAPAHRPMPREWPAEAGDIRDALVAHGLEARLADSVVGETVTHLLPFSSPAQLENLVVDALAKRIPVRPLMGTGGRVVAFVGPGGSGKTRCLARLAAAYGARSDLPVACVSLRPADGGTELSMLLGPAGVPTHAVTDAASARERITALRENALVLIDTPGVSPRAEAELRALQVELDSLGVDEILVTVPATMGAGPARELVSGIRRLRPTGMALTHADETTHIGTAVGLAVDTGLPVAYVARGTLISSGLRPADGEELARALLD